MTVRSPVKNLRSALLHPHSFNLCSLCLSAPLRQKRTSHRHPFARSVSVRGSKSLAPHAKRTTLKLRPGRCSVLIFRLFRLFRRPPSPAHPSSNEQPSNSDPDQNFSTSFHFFGQPNCLFWKRNQLTGLRNPTHENPTFISKNTAIQHDDS